MAYTIPTKKGTVYCLSPILITYGEVRSLFNRPISKTELAQDQMNHHLFWSTISEFNHWTTLRPCIYIKNLVIFSNEVVGSFNYNYWKNIYYFLVTFYFIKKRYIFLVISELVVICFLKYAIYIPYFVFIIGLLSSLFFFVEEADCCVVSFHFL